VGNVFDKNRLFFSDQHKTLTIALF